jgi:hypothetical protein
LRSGQALFSGLTEPDNRLLIVFCHAIAIGIAKAEIELGLGIALVGHYPNLCLILRGTRIANRV